MSALTEVCDVWVDLKEVQRGAVREDIEKRERAAGLEDIHSHGVDRVVLHPSVASDPCIKKILAQDAAIRRHLEAADNASELGLVYTTSTMDPPERVLRCGSTGTVIVDEDEPPSMWAQLIPEDPHPICRTDSEIAGLPDDPEAVIEEPMEAEPTPSVGGPHEHTGTTEVDDDEVEALCEGVDRLAAREAERRARRVLPAGDEVDDVRAAAARGVPGGEDALELGRDHAAVVHLDADPLNALCEGHVRHGAERELVREEGVAGFAEQPEALGDPVRVAEGKRAEMVRWRVVVLCELSHDALRIGKTCAMRILHAGLDGECTWLMYGRFHCM